jgi:hypothetical protein
VKIKSALPVYGDAAPLCGRRVCVYKNLTRGIWSIAEAKGAHGKGEVIAYAEHVALRDCETWVSEARRKAVCESGAKEVFAWVVGTITERTSTEGMEAATFRPHDPLGAFYVRATRRVVHRAAEMVFTRSAGAYVDSSAIGDGR